MIEERVAILESKLERNEQDIKNLFDFLRDHMEKEDADRKVFINLLSDMDNRLASQKSFWGGMIFAFSGIAAAIATALNWIKH